MSNNRAAIEASIIQAVLEVVEGQDMDVETLCALLQINQADILAAFPKNAVDYAPEFGVNPTLIGDLQDIDEAQLELDFESGNSGDEFPDLLEM